MQAGLTPLQALQAATRSAAEFLGTRDEAGTVERGKRADLVLLDANPLDDIRHTQKIHAVVVSGRFVRRTEIDAMLGTVAANAIDKPVQPNNAGRIRLVIKGGQSFEPTGC